MIDTFFAWISSRDWPLTFQVFSDIATVGAAIVAIFAISNWRRETSGKDKYEAAKNVRLLVPEIIQNIKNVNGLITRTDLDPILEKLKFDDHQ